jgi:hypothetical protein
MVHLLRHVSSLRAVRFFRVNTIMSRVCVAVAAVAALTGAPAAYADTGTGTGDAQFLQIIKLHIAGISNPTEGDAGLIKGGHAVYPPAV